MAHKVGTKGQVVIEKRIRDKLGVGPGWLAIQRVENGRVEISFVPPEHRRSLKGVLAKYVRKSAPPGPQWDKAREKAWAAIARERSRRLSSET